MSIRSPRLAASLVALACGALLALASAARSQDAPAPPAQAGAPAPGGTTPVLAGPALPQFQVEVLVFAHREFNPSEEQFERADGRSAPSPEQVLRQPPVFDDSNYGPLATSPSPALGGATPPQSAGAPPFGATPDAAQQDAAGAPNEFRFRLLRPEELQLSSQYRTLERLAAYHPIVHGGWVQLGLPEDQALPIDLGVLGVANPAGTIHLYLSRFLHVKLDLSYQDALAPTAAGAPPGAGAPLPSAESLEELSIKPRYHLTGERQVRSGELHYFDHPAFGVLIKITPVRPDPNASGAPGSRPAA